MATINAINSNIPIEVSKGGTGNASLTAHGILIGNGSSAIAALSVGSTGQLLVGASSADPAFAASASGDFTFTTATAAATRTFTVSNMDNTSASSNAAMVNSVGGTSGGDAYYQFAIGTARSYSWGPDTSDSQKLKINTGANATTTPSSGTNLWTMTSAGERIMPLQPCFSANKTSSTANNVTGDGTEYAIIFDNVIFQQGSAYSNSTGVFTAPVAGKYFFCFSALCAGIVAQTTGEAYLITPSGKYDGTYMSPATTVAAGGFLMLSSSACVILAASETVSFAVALSGSTKTCGVVGSAGGSGNKIFTHVNGFLIC